MGVDLTTKQRHHSEKGAQHMKSYPKPNRSDYKVNTTKSAQNEVIDVGWDEGFLPDARPFRAECWAESGITMVTFFFSTQGLETSTEAQLMEVLKQHGLIKPLNDKIYVTAMPMSDASGNDMWSVNIVVGDENQIFLEDELKLRPYSL
jgi:hypothetical protein